MKILPLLQNRFNTNSINVIGMQRNSVTSPLLFGNKDTVSFGAFNEIAHQEFEEINKTIEKELVPIMKDSKDLYNAVGKIGYIAQEAANAIEKKENDLINHRFDLTNADVNPSLAMYRDYTSRIKEYAEHKRSLVQLKNMSELPMYKTEEVKSKLEIAEDIINAKNQEIEKIKPLVSFYEMTMTELSNRLEKQKPSIEGKPFDILMNAQYFMIINPYNDSAKVLKQRDEIKEELKTPKISMLNKLDKIEILQRETYRILESKENFYNNKSEIQKFVQEHKDVEKKLPSQKEIDGAYKAVIDRCDDIAKDYTDEIDEYYKKNYTDKNLKVDFDSIDSALEQQKKAVREVQSLIDKLKTDYISKQNDELMKKWYPQDFEED